MGHGYQHRFQLQLGHRPRHGPCQQLVPDVIALAASTDHSDLHGPSSFMAFEHQYDHRRQPRWQQELRTSVQTLAVAGTWPQARPPSADLACMTPWPWLAVHIIQVTVAQPSDTNSATGSFPDLGHLCVPWWQPGPWISTEIQAEVGPWAQTWSLAEARVQKSSWP